jgi:hypothetical protein
MRQFGVAVVLVLLLQVFGEMEEVVLFACGVYHYRLTDGFIANFLSNTSSKRSGLNEETVVLKRQLYQKRNYTEGNYTRKKPIPKGNPYQKETHTKDTTHKRHLPKTATLQDDTPHPRASPIRLIPSTLRIPNDDIPIPRPRLLGLHP